MDAVLYEVDEVLGSMISSMIRLLVMKYMVHELELVA